VASPRLMDRTIPVAEPAGAQIDAGLLVFQHACRLDLEGIVSKHKDSRYHSDRSRHWIKSKNPLSPAVRREAEIDWCQRWPRRARSSPSR
jgi:ATP-dependent DNA ligase